MRVVNHESITINLAPPQWWLTIRLVFALIGGGFLAIGLYLIFDYAESWSTSTQNSRLQLFGALVYIVIGIILIVLASVKRLSKPRLLEIGSELLTLPRYRKGDLVTLSYSQIVDLLWIGPSFLRIRLQIKTEQGDFWINRFWLPADYSLAKVAGLIRSRMKSQP
ncbi:MAG: hypothetical protein EOP06_02140 [Proteobacteria bacterium]|nr:MAG: hypothetical protein EOP06_02140 [Pseudomonadota bacterium]